MHEMRNVLRYTLLLTGKMSNYFMDIIYVCLSTPLKFTRCLMHTLTHSHTYEKLVKIIWIAVQCKNKTANTVALKCNSIVYYYCYCFRFECYWWWWCCCCYFCWCSCYYYVLCYSLLLSVLLLLFCRFVQVNRWTNYPNFHTLNIILILFFRYLFWFTINVDSHTTNTRTDNCREWIMNLLNLKLYRFIANNGVRDECMLILEIRQPSNLTLKFVHKQYQDHFQCINISTMWKF